MATYNSVVKYGSGFQDNMGGVTQAAAVWEIGSATLGTADVLSGPTVPANAQIVACGLVCTDIDTGTTLTLDVGDATDDNRLMSAQTTGQAGGTTWTMATTGIGYKYTAATRIDVTPAAAAAGGVAGGVVSLLLHYIVVEPTT